MNARLSHFGETRNPISFRLCQRGFAIVSAIFLLVVLAALGAFMLTFSTVQHATSAQDIQGSRAYWAAQSGIEWGIYKVLDPLNTTVVAPGSASWPNMPPCPAATLTIEGFTVAVSCTNFPAGAAGASGPPVYTEAGDTRSIAVYELTATATSTGAPGSPGYVERQMKAAVSKCRASDAPAPPYDCPL